MFLPDPQREILFLVKGQSQGELELVSIQIQIH